MRTGWSLRLVVFFVVVASLSFGQVGNGIITGTITDPAGAVVVGAKVDAKNVETGVVSTGPSTTAGAYTIADLPPGTYVVTVTAAGFKTYTHSNFAVASATTVRQDVSLQVGSATESVTVTAESTLLKTESAELATNYTLTQLDELPVFGIGTNNAGVNGFRNPYATLQLMPGVTSNNTANSTGFGFVVNGLAGQVQTLKIEGQEATDRTIGFLSVEEAQPGLDAIQEVSYQVSNYSPEFGQAGTVVVNMTMKGGTNQYHGSGYDYFVNEDLNAGDPFSTTGCIYPISRATTAVPTCAPSGGTGGKYRPRSRRNNFGGTLGGPIYIPKIYDGHNRTFFFWSYEQYAETTQLTFADTVPTADYLAGNFGHISPNGDCSLCSQLGIPTTPLGTPTVQKDALGNAFYANTIYDPATRGVVASSQLGYALPFPNNIIPASRFDPLYVKVQSLINTLGVKAQNTNLTQNYTGRIPATRYSAIPSIKIDHNIDAKDKLSFYYSHMITEGQINTPLGNADGLPTEIGAYRGTFVPAWTYRLNYDRSIRPTLLLHLGVGYLYTTFSDAAPFLNFDPSAFGLTGFLHNRQFPSFTGMTDTTYGGMQTIGTAGQIQSFDHNYKPTAVASATWIHGKHTYKMGADAFWEGTITETISGVSFGTGVGPTSQPFTTTQNFNGFTTGNGYASWMLGNYTSSSQTAQLEPRLGSSAWDLYLQDSWKVTRKLTLDYGVRWDLFTVQHEEYGRWGQFSETLANGNAGGHPGATVYASNCNCQFYQKNYPYAIGPRIGVAYQINPKTVFRAGWGLTYAYIESPAGANVSTNGAYPLTPGINQFVNETAPGFIQQPTWPVTDPNRYPLLGTNTGLPYMPDANQNRPARTNQFSAGFQREITRSFVMEASYVGNRSAWLAGSLGGGALNHISAAQYASLGLYPYPGTGPAGYAYKPTGLACQAGNDCDRALLSQALSSTLVIQKLASVGLTSPSQYLPYSGFPLSNTIASILRPFPQFGAIGPGVNPTGNSKYDSVQIKATKRFSHGLQAGGFFTWAQGFTRAVRQEYFNPASAENALQTAIPPRTLNFNFIYQTPKSSFLPKWANFITRDWQITGSGNYQSAAFLGIPATPNAEQLGTQDVYITGTPLYLDKTGNPTNVNPLNDPKSINGATDLVLNPAAWAPCPVNTNCGSTGAYVMKNFRGVRHPSESAGIGRNFRIKERMSLQFRGDFVNIFNRIAFPSPSTANPQNPVTRNSLGYITGGFGSMPTYVAPGTGTFTGRTGTLLLKFSF